MDYVTSYALHTGKSGIPYLTEVREHACPGKRISSPEELAEIVSYAFDVELLAEEYMFLICCDTKGQILGLFEVSHGTVNHSLVSSREIFIRALLCGAAYIFVAHNHPSGDVSPSKEDYAVTRRIKEAGNIINVPLLDHVIVGGSGEIKYFSFREDTNEIIEKGD